MMVEISDIETVFSKELEWIKDKNDMAAVMADQLSNTVRWADLVKKLGRKQKKIFFEVGPGNIISRTVKWIDRILIERPII